MVSRVPRGSIMGQMRSGWGGTTLSDLSSPPFISRQPPRATLPPRALPHPSCGLVMYIYLTTGSIMLFLWCSTYAGINTRYLCTTNRYLKITICNITWITNNYIESIFVFVKIKTEIRYRRFKIICINHLKKIKFIKQSFFNVKFPYVQYIISSP